MNSDTINALIDSTIAYMKEIITPDYFNSLSDVDKRKFIRSSLDEIVDVYPLHTDKLTPRMIAIQVNYNAEGEQEGFAVLRRQNIEDYQVKDVHAKLSKENLSPYLIAIFDDLIDDSSNKSGGRIGRLI